MTGSGPVREIEEGGNGIGRSTVGIRDTMGKADEGEKSCRGRFKDDEDDCRIEDNFF